MCCSVLNTPYDSDILPYHLILHIKTVSMGRCARLLASAAWQVRLALSQQQELGTERSSMQVRTDNGREAFPGRVKNSQMLSCDNKSAALAYLNSKSERCTHPQ